jgi:hypothetical protein
MSLTTNLYFFGTGYDRQPSRRTVMDALIARLPEEEQRQRVAALGAIRVACDDFNWLLNSGGAATLLDPPVEAFMVAIRKFGDAPVYLTPLDLVRRFHAVGWIPEEQLADLPPEALKPPQEEDAISLDRVIARFFPPGVRPPLEDPEEMRQRSISLQAAINAHCAEQRAPHGALGDAEEP